MRWRRDDRQQPDDRTDVPAEEWLSQFRPVRPESLTAADPDALDRPPTRPAVSSPGRDWASASPPETDREGRGLRRLRPDADRRETSRRDGSPGDGSRRRGRSPDSDWSDGGWSGAGWSGGAWSDGGWSDGGWSNRGRTDAERTDGWSDSGRGEARSENGRAGGGRANDSWAQLAARPASPNGPGDRDDRPARQHDHYSSERSRSSALYDTISQPEAADPLGGVPDRRPDRRTSAPDELGRDGRGGILDGRREPQRNWGELEAERGTRRDDRRRAEPDRRSFALETSYLHGEPRSAPEPAGGTGFELGPDAYRDDGRGGTPDLHRFNPSLPVAQPPRRSEPPAARDDDVATSPLPVILPGATALPRPAHVEAPRGFFEPARPSQGSVRSPSITGSVEPPTGTFAAPVVPPSTPSGPQPMPAAAAAKLDQIKDLYLTAEAIGGDALHKHFDQVSQRQQELIREFFERSNKGTQG